MEIPYINHVYMFVLFSVYMSNKRIPNNTLIGQNRSTTQNGTWDNYCQVSYRTKKSVIFTNQFFYTTQAKDLQARNYLCGLMDERPQKQRIIHLYNNYRTLFTLEDMSS